MQALVYSGASAIQNGSNSSWCIEMAARRLKKWGPMSTTRLTTEQATIRFNVTTSTEAPPPPPRPTVSIDRWTLEMWRRELWDGMSFNCIWRRQVSACYEGAIKLIASNQVEGGRCLLQCKWSGWNEWPQFGSSTRSRQNGCVMRPLLKGC